MCKMDLLGAVFFATVAAISFRQAQIVDKIETPNTVRVVGVLIRY